MRTINIRDARKQLFRLVRRAAQGESFIIAKAGKPMVKVIPFSQENISTANRLGFMQGEFTVPADFDEYRKAGADIVMTATGAMWNPLLARDIKTKSLKLNVYEK